MTIGTDSDNRAIAAQPHGIGAFRCNGYNASPAGDIALPELRASSSDNRTLRCEANTVVAPSGHSDNLCPVLTTIPECSVPSGTHRTVCYKTDGMQISGGDSFNPVPIMDIALAVGVVSSSTGSSVKAVGRNMPISASDASHIMPMRHNVRRETSGRDDSSIVTQTHTEAPSRSNGSDISPIF